MHKYKRKKQIKKKNKRKTPKKAVVKKAPEMKKYRMVKKLNAGNYAKVFAVVDKETNKKYALKVIDLYRDGDKVSAKYKEAGLARALKEVEILKQLEVNGKPSEYAVGFKEAFPQGPSKFCIVQELFEGKDLSDFIEENHRYDNKFIRASMCYLFSCLAYIHELNIVHRDIKADNIMIARSGGKLVMKLIDFGYACRTDVNQTNKLCCTYGKDKWYGTEVYMAPERFYNQERDGFHTFEDMIARNPSWWKKGDVYAMGIVIYEMVMKALFYEDSPLESEKEDFKKSSRYALEYEGKYVRPSNIKLDKISDPLIRRVIELATIPVPNDRPYAIDILRVIRDGIDK